MNNVLRRLREDQVTTVNQTTYSKMVGDFINDAKVSALRSTVSIVTVASDNQYSLTGCGDNVKVMSALNDTENCYLLYQTKDWFNERLYLNEIIDGAPKYYTFDGLDSNGDTQVLVSPRPNAAQTLRFDVMN
jgi:hypothetical protein